MREPSIAPYSQPSDSSQSNKLHPQKPQWKKVKQLLDYATTHPDAIVIYNASNMVLAGHNDTSYLSETNVQSHVGGHFFMSEDSPDPPNNGAILTIAQIIKAVMSSAAEAKLVALFIKCRQAIPARLVLEEMGHKQPPTLIQTDSTTSLGDVQNNMATKRLKLMDMKFHWLRCQAAQRQFRHYWRAGLKNRGN